MGYRVSPGTKPVAIDRIALEKENIINALKEANWKISGENGAAALLQIPPTTFNSRITKLGIRKIDD